MKLLVVLLGLLCMKGSHAFFGVKVTGVALETDIKTAITPISMGLTALQKSLVDLQTAILAQVGVGSTELLLVRKDVDVLISYFKFVGLVVSDLLKLSADASIPVARVFALLMADTGAVAKFVTDSHPETSGMNLDMIFKTTLQAQITQINTAMMLLGTELPKLQGSVQKAQGVLTALTAISVGAALDANNVAMIKTALASTSTAIGLISPQIVSLTITIMSENMVSAAVAKPLSGITTSLNAVIATITTEVAKQADTLKKSVATNLVSVNTAISGFTAKLQGMYTDTIVPPVMTETIKACEDYNLAVSTSLNLVNTGFSAQATLLLDPKAEMGNLYVKDVAAILASVNVDANKIVKYMITALKQNSVVARTCVMKTMATAGTIFTVAAAQFDSCLKIVLPTFSDEEKLGEDALKVITKKAVDFMGQMATCMTPTTGTTNQRKVIVNCLKDYNSQLATQSMADMGAQKTAKDTVTTIMMDFTSVESDYNTCISAAGATLKKSMEAFTAAFDLCVPPASS